MKNITKKHRFSVQLSLTRYELTAQMFRVECDTIRLSRHPKSTKLCQCDQIWRNSTSGKILKLLGIFWGFILCFAKFWTHFGKSFILFCKFSLFLRAKHQTNNVAIWSHWTWNSQCWYLSREQFIYSVFGSYLRPLIKPRLNTLLLIRPVSAR